LHKPNVFSGLWTVPLALLAMYFKGFESRNLTLLGYLSWYNHGFLVFGYFINI